MPDKVLRTFTAGRGRVRVGMIVDGSNYRNLGFLRRRGYLAPMPEDTPLTSIDEVETDADIEPLEDGIPELSDRDDASTLAVTEGEPVPDAEDPAEDDVPAILDAVDPLEEVAAAPVGDIAKPNLSKMTKAQLVAEAERIGVKVVPDTMTNKQIIAAIEKAEIRFDG